MHVRKELAPGGEKRDDQSARAENAPINSVDCVHRSILRSDTP